jgi:hypothetical protein
VWRMKISAEARAKAARVRENYGLPIGNLMGDGDEADALMCAAIRRALSEQVEP